MLFIISIILYIAIIAVCIANIVKVIQNRFRYGADWTQIPSFAVSLAIIIFCVIVLLKML